MNVDIAGLSESATEFPYILLTPQSEAERVFEEFLIDRGVEVIRNRKVIGFRESSEEGLRVYLEDGSSVIASYVVGADGARSTVSASYLFNEQDSRFWLINKYPGPKFSGHSIQRPFEQRYV